jgi:hypothetical protein
MLSYQRNVYIPFFLSSEHRELKGLYKYLQTWLVQIFIGQYEL